MPYHFNPAMIRKSLLLLPLVAALSAVSLPARASTDYHVVVPAPGKVEQYAAIKLELNPATLPVGRIGDPFAGFNFNTALLITGDPNLDMSQVTWSVSSGSLPSGLALTRDGSLYGSPTEIGESGFQVLAKYKTKAVVGTYQIAITKFEKQIIAAAGTRTWDDGTIAGSCKDYMNPTWPYIYEGDTGDGMYRIAPGGIEPFDVRCDMTTDGGGWTLVEYRQDLEFKNWYEDGDRFRWVPTNFSLNQTDAQINAIRAVSSVALQRYVGLCEGVVHYYSTTDTGYMWAIGFRYHTGVETNSGSATYSPAKVKVVQDGCKANGFEAGRLETATIFDIENINLPIKNVATLDAGHTSELFGSPLTQYPARFR